MFNYFLHFDEMSDNWRFVESHIRNRWYKVQFSPAAFISSRICRRIRDLWEMTVEMNDSNQTSVQIFSSLQRNVHQLVICRKSHFKRMILKRVLFNYFEHFQEMSNIWGLVENHIGMNYCKHSSVELFSLIRRNVLNLRIW